MTQADPYRQYRPAQRFLEEAYRITYESQISFATEALKLLGLANGAAAIGLLTFVSDTSANGEAAANLVCPALAFCIGLLFCMIAFVGCYYCQMFLMKYWSERESARAAGATDEEMAKENKWADRHKRTFWLVLIGIAGSLAGFAVGVVSAAKAISG